LVLFYKDVNIVSS